MNPFQRSPKVVAAWGALTLWVIFPIVFGGLILVANKLISSGHQSVWAMLGIGLWAIVAFTLMLVGFAWLLIAVFVYVRGKDGRAVVRTTRERVSREERDAVLREVVSSRGNDSSGANRGA